MLLTKITKSMSHFIHLQKIHKGKTNEIERILIFPDETRHWENRRRTW